MKAFLEATWWMLLLRGLALLLFGFFAVVWPGLTLGALALGFAVYLMLSGVVTLVTNLVGIGRVPLWFLGMVMGALEVGVGVFALKNTGMTAATLVILLGLVFVVRGVLELLSAFGDGHEGRTQSLAAITGALSLVAGVTVWVYPEAGALAAVWVLGLYGLIGGAFMTAMALEARPTLIARRPA